MKLAIRTLFICLLFAGQSVSAVEVEGLFEAEVIVQSEQEKDGKAAIQQALKIVLTRVLVGKNIFQDATVKTVLSDASHYVDEYQHSLIVQNRKEQKDTRLIRVLFDEKLLLDVFRPSKLRFWNEIRPRTLIWLVVEKDGQETLFDPDAMPIVEAAFENAAKQKALPLLYPMRDLTENKALSISDVLSAYSNRLLAVSSRYDVVSTLAGKIVKKNQCWQAEWTFYFDKKIKQWQSQCSSLNTTALKGIQGTYDTLSRYYAAKSNVKKINSLILKISNINTPPALEKVNQYLETLTMIKTVTWMNTESGYNNYRVFFQGERQLLNSTLVKDRVLRAENYSGLEAKEVKFTLLTN